MPTARIRDDYWRCVFLMSFAQAAVAVLQSRVFLSIISSRLRASPAHEDVNHTLRFDSRRNFSWSELFMQCGQWNDIWRHSDDMRSPLSINASLIWHASLCSSFPSCLSTTSIKSLSSHHTHTSIVTAVAMHQALVRSFVTRNSTLEQFLYTVFKDESTSERERERQTDRQIER